MIFLGARGRVLSLQISEELPGDTDLAPLQEQSDPFKWESPRGSSSKMSQVVGQQVPVHLRGSIKKTALAAQMSLSMYLSSQFPFSI